MLLLIEREHDPVGQQIVDEIHPHGRGQIDNRGGRVRTDRVNRQDGNASFRAEFEHKRHDGLRLRIVLPARFAESAGGVGKIN